jgi:hypothetical protein
MVSIAPACSQTSIARNKHPVIGITHHRNKKGPHSIVVADPVIILPLKTNPIPLDGVFLELERAFPQMQSSSHFSQNKA